MEKLVKSLYSRIKNSFSYEEKKEKSVKFVESYKYEALKAFVKATDGKEARNHKAI
jgi:hypothetical protein